MKTRNIAFVSVLILLGGALSLMAGEEAEILLSDLTSLQLDLCGADHYYWITPEMGRVVINRQCVSSDGDCDHDVLNVWDEQGHQVFECAPFLDIPDTHISHGHVFSTALRSPDRLAVSTIVGTKDFTFALAEYDVDKGELLRVLPTSPISCWDLRGDGDGTIWCLGVDLSKRKDDQDFDLVYRFDESGRQLGSALPRSAFPETPDPLSVWKRQSGLGGFLPGNGEVRLWLPAVEELISFDSDGKVRDRLILPTVEGLERARLVTAPGYEIFALLTVATDHEDRETWTQGLFRLTLDGASWTPLEEPLIHLPLRFTLVGADSSGLILLDRRSTTLVWYPVTTEVATDNSTIAPP